MSDPEERQEMGYEVPALCVCRCVCVCNKGVRGWAKGQDLLLWLQPPAPASSCLCWPHLCGCLCASAAAPGAGGGCGRSARHPAALVPCEPPRGRGAAHYALGALTPPCRHHQWSPPVGGAKGPRTGGLELSFPSHEPAPPCALSFCSPSASLSLSVLICHLHSFFACSSVFLCHFLSMSLCLLSHSAFPWGPFLCPCTYLSACSFPSYSHPHLVHIEVVYDSIKASIQVIEQGHHLEGRRSQEGWRVRVGWAKQTRRQS
jgi:hypothetical protein